MNNLREMGSRLSGTRLIIARVGWIVLAGLMVGLFIAAVPVRINQLLTITPLGDNALTVLSTNEAAALEQHGIPLGLYALYFITLEIVFAAVFCLIGGLLLMRSPNEPLALFASLALVAFGVLIPGTMRVLDTSISGLEFPIHLVQVLGWISFFMSFHVFPDGKFVPGWTRFLLVLFVLWGIAWIFIPAANAFNWPLPVALIAFGAVSMFGVLAQAYRYYRVSTASERQQTKWVLLGFAGAAIGTGAFAIPGILWPFLNLPGLARVIYHVFGVGLFALSLLLIPVTLEISVRRYRLWAIDPLINRVLVYSLLTIGLGAFYAGSVVFLQQVFRNVTGVGNDLAIVISTLAIAALFFPVRKRIQDAIDRRFYRRKYDAALVLARFSERIQQEIDLDEVSSELTEIVRDAFEPSHVSLWLVTNYQLPNYSIVQPPNFQTKLP